MTTFVMDSERRTFRDILFVSILVFAVSGTADARTWTSRSGETLDAELVRMESGYALLENAEGSRLKIGILDLSKQDIEYIDRQRRNGAGSVAVQALYRQIGTDPPFKRLIDNEIIPVGRNSRGGVEGSTIDVNNARVERGGNAAKPIPKRIGIHTLCHSHIDRDEFDRWTRWYQEDGNTQVFRLFRAEHNVRNSRPDAARIEAFSKLKWRQGEWHEWVGTYTIVKPHGCMIFQVKNNVNDWAVSIILGDDGDIILNPRRRQKRKVIAREMTGKSFDLKVRDNGHDYEVYLDGKKVGAGYYDRPEGITNFRWGMYDGTISHDAMIFVTGAKFKKLSRYEQKSIGSEPRREKITNYSNWFKKMPFNKTGKD